MSLVLQPQASFTIVRQIPNHLDANTYYVQAVIRNAYTDAIIETVQLTSRGAQRFSKNWTVPADPSQQGFYVSIVTSVYTDSGYTTKSGDYGDDENTYLVQERVMTLMRGGSLDAFTVRRIIKEELAVSEAEEPDSTEEEDTPEEPEPAPRWDEVLSAISKVGEVLSGLPQEKADDSKVLAAIAKIAKAIKDKPVTEKTDLTPILERLDEDQRSDELDREEVQETMTEIADMIAPSVRDAVREEMDHVGWVGTFSTLAVRKEGFNGKAPEKDDEEADEPLDLTKIAS